MEVLSGGVDSASTIGSGGTETVFAGGAAIGNFVISTGVEVISAGGSAVGLTVQSGGFEYVSGNDSGSTIGSGGTQSAARTVTNAQIDGGVQYISGGLAVSNTVGNNGFEYAVQGGVIQHSLVLSGGTEGLLSSGAGNTDSGSTIAAGGTQFVEDGALASGTIVSGGDQILYSGGTASNGLIQAGGTQTISSGGTDSASLIASGGTQDINDSGTAVDTIVAVSGTQNVAGTAIGAIVSGGTQNVLDVGSASGGVVEAGGNTFVYGNETGITIGSGGTVTLSGGTANSNTIQAGGTEIVTSGGLGLGLDAGSTIEAGGLLAVYDSGLAIGTNVGSGGTLELFSGGAMSGAIFASGGILEAGSGYVASGVTFSGGEILEVAASGSALSTTIVADSQEIILSGGQATSTTLVSGGSEIISLGGLDTSAFVFTAGVQTVLAGGSATDTIVSGGAQDVFGTAIGVTLENTGVQTVELGGVASGTEIQTGASQILSGGTAVDATIEAAAFQDIVGGAASSTTVSGGFRVRLRRQPCRRRNGRTSNGVRNAVQQQHRQQLVHSGINDRARRIPAAAWPASRSSAAARWMVSNSRSAPRLPDLVPRRFIHLRRRHRRRQYADRRCRVAFGRHGARPDGQPRRQPHHLQQRRRRRRRGSMTAAPRPILSDGTDQQRHRQFGTGLVSAVKSSQISAFMISGGRRRQDRQRRHRLPGGFGVRVRAAPSWCSAAIHRSSSQAVPRWRNSRGPRPHRSTFNIFDDDDAGTDRTTMAPTALTPSTNDQLRGSSVPAQPARTLISGTEGSMRLSDNDNHGQTSTLSANSYTESVCSSTTSERDHGQQQPRVPRRR